jgi:plastocyanin
MRRLALAAPFAALALAAPAAAADHVIVLANMRFGALPANLKVGDTITWENRDMVAHTASARDRSFDVTLQPHQAKRITLRRAGPVAFSCRYHPAMQGELRVAAR